MKGANLSFSVASYNVLANAFVRRGWYPRTPALVLDPSWRVPALVHHVSKLGADIVCLQEVEPPTFVSLRTYLSERGYDAQYARKNGAHPDGIAIFYRRKKFALLGARARPYADGGDNVPDTGYIAMFACFRGAGGVLGVINTHLIWDPPDTPRGARIGWRQSQQLLTEFQNCRADARGWIIGGDFNVTPESEIISQMEQAGLRYAHAGQHASPTCNVHASARMIDYLFYSSSLAAEPQSPTLIDDETVLPSAEQPSDHLAVISKFEWIG